MTGLCTIIQNRVSVQYFMVYVQGYSKKNMTVKMTYNSHNMTTPSLNYV